MMSKISNCLGYMLQTLWLFDYNCLTMNRKTVCGFTNCRIVGYVCVKEREEEKRERKWIKRKRKSVAKHSSMTPLHTEHCIKKEDQQRPTKRNEIEKQRKTTTNRRRPNITDNLSHCSDWFTHIYVLLSELG